MDGLFQLLIILFFVVASIFDAVSRNKKKQEQKERLDRDEGAEGALEEGVGGARGTRPRPGAPARPRPRPIPVEGRRKAPTGESASRETADQMIPEDFWAVLTGQTPGQRTPPAPQEAPSPEPAAAAPESARWETGAMAPAGTPMDGARGEVGDEGTGTRRSSRWMEGLGSEEELGMGEVARRPSPPTPSRATTTGFPGGTRTFPQAPPPPRKPASPFGQPRRDPMEEPWGDLEDISRGEIGDGRGAVQGAVELDGEGRSRRRGSSASPLVRLVASGRQEDLQAAIVLREVLGAPVGSRSVSEEPGGWRWEGR